MAQRRMFSKQIIDSDAFLDMGASAQSLYFHLAMRADDDGFVNNPRKIQRMIGAADDDLKILIAKRFVIMFESGVIVIKHWRMHNYIRSDRYNETAYIDEKSQLSIKENGSYTLNGNHLATTCLPDGNHLDTQVRLGKDSVVNDSKSTAGEPLKVPKELKAKRVGIHPMFDAFWQAYPKRIAKAKAEEAFSKLNPDEELMKVMIAAIKAWSKTDQWTKESGQFVPNPTTWINQRRWEDELPKDNKPKEKPIIMMN